MSDDKVATLFLEGARAVAHAIGDGAVGRAWDRPSVLEDQLVSGLCGHLARGGVWVVAEYLDGREPTGPVDYETAAGYFVAVSTVPLELHLASRQRGADIAAAGQAVLVRQLADRIGVLEAAIGTRFGAPGAHGGLVTVIGGKVMRLSDFLETRIVEQAVHLDDLARSVGAEPFAYPAAGRECAVAVAIATAAEQAGWPGLLRALYRRGFADECFPVM
jgi:hypothetical protein